MKDEVNIPTVTQAEIDGLMEASEVSVKTIFDKVTLVAVKLPNGFVLTESAGAVSKANYSEEIGKEVCLSKIKQQLWKLEGYRLACEVGAAPAQPKIPGEWVSEKRIPVETAELLQDRLEALYEEYRDSSALFPEERGQVQAFVEWARLRIGGEA